MTEPKRDEMTLREFIYERIDAMGTRPAMYARSKESLGLQLALLAEIALFDVPEKRTSHTGLGPVVELMRRLFGPGNTIPDEDADDAWAKRSAVITRTFLEEQLVGVGPG